jgi:hypothetical protein
VYVPLMAHDTAAAERCCTMLCALTDWQLPHVKFKGKGFFWSWHVTTKIEHDRHCPLYAAMCPVVAPAAACQLLQPASCQAVLWPHSAMIVPVPRLVDCSSYGVTYG